LTFGLRCRIIWLFFLEKLSYLEKGLAFFWIGLLIGFREVCINLLEIPTGAVADLYGRRRCMVASMSAYIVSFVIFALSAQLWHLFAAMLLFAVGDAFRTGTHKALILTWLRRQGRSDEKTKVYGYTRSWSQVGSALNALIAAGLVFYTGSYGNVFWFSLIPYVVNLVNLGTYPKYLDGDLKPGTSMKDVVVHLLSAGGHMLKSKELRRVLVESMSFDGVYATIKDYLQPMLKLLALSLPIMVAVSERSRTALLVGLVYFLLFLLSSVASRQAHRLADRWGGEEPAAGRLWLIAFAIYAALLPLLYFQSHAGVGGLVVVAFVLLAVMHNFWRPVTIGRYGNYTDERFTATVLSVDSQAKSGFTFVAAPLLGLVIDLVNRGMPVGAEKNFWPVAVLGLVVAGTMVLLGLIRTRATGAVEPVTGRGPAG